MTARPATKDKLTIWFIGPHGRFGGVEAFYNPKQITIDKTIPWTSHAGNKTNAPSLEFTNGGVRSMSLELFFDTYETGENVHTKHIEKLEKGTVVMEGTTGSDQRPPTCLITWATGFPKFAGVIESLSVTYTMFFSDGTPCRATATIKLKEPPPIVVSATFKAFKAQTPQEREASFQEYQSRR